MKKLISIAAALLWLCTATYAAGQVEKDVLLDACAALKSAQKRAKCFENVARIQPVQSQKSPEQGNEYKILIEEAKAVLVKDFKDPAAVQWRGIFVSDSSISPFVCGELNGKNSYGAYVGYRRFLSTRNYSMIEGEKEPMFDSDWAITCKKIIYRMPDV